MKNIYYLFFLLPILNSGAQEVQKQSEQSILKESVEKSMNYLASDALEGRKTGTEGLEKAAVYIETFFKSNNIKPFFETYRDSFNIQDLVGYNIVGYIEGHDPKLKNEFVVLGGHYDHIGSAKEVNGDTVANGANDDASGTVAVMEWAKHFAKAKSNKRSILFTLYDAEEMGLKGSEHLAKRLKEMKIDLYTMINFEMIGVPRAEGEIMAYVTGYKESNMAEKLNSYAKEELIGFLAQAKAYGLFKRSDNYPFYKAFKVPAQAISTFDFTNFEYYHHVDDEVEFMDFQHMINFINKMIPALEGMINAPTKEIKLHE
ncbi:M20/M25/M40 family metallo-hydrolase [Tamlana sp. 2_MG-2023]|uniref:M28 family metallopeptidase n=1 Tax=unclassified Tamlana TaxID=2614803 RepID=UPI0026E1C0CD|nr:MULTISPECIES: M20/M25/M40 family metallo-hydrolase [unclassified Tamlana]MDO6760901.1 M20/M25/M40 family metallo-hydrolase [Tamlana sp. 2_MG-2023]MDO6791157.1 M20/M25/M40 family metallo-hydrolase [Tamlana sp. 1_MG-2023]